MLQYEGPEGTWGFSKKDRSKSLNCAIRSNELVIRSIELDNLFSRIAICSLELHISFPRFKQSIVQDCPIRGNELQSERTSCRGNELQFERTDCLIQGNELQSDRTSCPI